MISGEISLTESKCFTNSLDFNFAKANLVLSAPPIEVVNPTREATPEN